ncbi:MAG: hypothetical protein EOO75_05830, partial [Myxococcales bacterium]
MRGARHDRAGDGRGRARGGGRGGDRRPDRQSIRRGAVSDPGSSGRQATSGSAALAGIAASPGVAVGTALVLAPQTITYVRRTLRSAEIEGELGRFKAAVAAAQDELRAMGARSGGSRNEHSIIEAYLLMVADETLAREVEGHVRRDRRCAARAPRPRAP